MMITSNLLVHPPVQTLLKPGLMVESTPCTSQVPKGTSTASFIFTAGNVFEISSVTSFLVLEMLN